MTKQEYLTASLPTHAAKQLLDTSAPRAGNLELAQVGQTWAQARRAAAILAVGARVFTPRYLRRQLGAPTAGSRLDVGAYAHTPPHG